MKKLLIAASIFLSAGRLMATDGTVVVIDKIAPKNGAFTGVVDSSQTLNNTTNFNGNLSSADNTVQKALDTLDNLSAGTAISVYPATGPVRINQFLTVGTFTTTSNGFYVDQDGDFWIVSNASYTMSTNQWNRIDTTKAAFGIELIGRGLFPGEVDQGTALWRCAAGANPISSTFGAVGGWELGWDLTSNRDLVVGGSGIEMDGHGVSPFGRLVHVRVNGSTHTGVAQNIFADFSGVDSSTRRSWFFGIKDDYFTIERSTEASQPSTLFKNLMIVSTSPITDSTTGYSSVANASADFLNIRSSATILGALRLSPLNCTGNANGGAITANSTGELVCSDDDSGSGGSSDSLGTHVATKTITAGFGISGTTVTLSNTVTAVNALTVTSTGTGNVISVVSNGFPSNGWQNNNGGAVNIQMNGAHEGLVIVSSVVSTQNGSSFVNLINNATGYNDPIFWIHDVGRESNPFMRVDSAAPDMEMVNTSTDNTHGLGKWEPMAIAYQGTYLQVNSRAWNNGTFERVAGWRPRSTGTGIELYPTVNGEEGAIGTTNTFQIIWLTTDTQHEVGLRGPQATTNSWWWTLPATFNNAGQVLYQSANGPDRNLSFSTGGANGMVLTSFGNSVIWSTPTATGGSGVTVYPATATPRVDLADPWYELLETDQVAPAGKYKFGVGSDEAYVAGRNGADSADEKIVTFGAARKNSGNPYMAIESSGTIRFEDGSSSYIGFKSPVSLGGSWTHDWWTTSDNTGKILTQDTSGAPRALVWSSTFGKAGSEIWASSNLIVGIGATRTTFYANGAVDSGSQTIRGNLRVATLNCSGNTNGGALTADSSGLISCSDDDSGGAGGVSVYPATSTIFTSSSVVLRNGVNVTTVATTGITIYDGSVIATMTASNLSIEGITVGINGLTTPALAGTGIGQTNGLSLSNVALISLDDSDGIGGSIILEAPASISGGNVEIILPSSSTAGMILQANGSIGGGGSASTSFVDRIASFTITNLNSSTSTISKMVASTATITSSMTVLGPFNVHLPGASPGYSFTFDPETSVQIFNQESAGTPSGVFSFQTLGVENAYFGQSGSNVFKIAVATVGTNGGSGLGSTGRISINNSSASDASIVFNESNHGFTLGESSMTFESGSTDPTFSWLTDGVLNLTSGNLKVNNSSVCREDGTNCPSGVVSISVYPATSTVVLPQGIRIPKNLITTSYVIKSTDSVILASSTANSISTMTLPSAASNAGQWVQITKVDKSTNPVVLLPAAGEFISGITTVTLQSFMASQELISDGISNWIPKGGRIASRPSYMGNNQDVASAAAGVSSTTYFQAWELQTPCDTKNAVFNVGTNAGLVNIVIYDEYGQLKVSSANAVPGGTGTRTIALPVVNLQPGTYYLGLQPNNAVITFTRYASNMLGAAMYSKSATDFTILQSIGDPPSFDNASTRSPAMVIECYGGAP